MSDGKERGFRMRWQYAGMLVVVMLTVAACGRGKTATTPSAGPRFATLILTDDPHRTTEKSVFTPDTQRIYIIFTLADVPERTTIKSIWIAEKAADDRDHKIDEASIVIGGRDNRGTLSISRPVSGWPAGKYRVDLSIADRPAITRLFRVEGTVSMFGSGPWAHRLWVDQGNGTYEHLKHGLRLVVVVPDEWVIEKEEQFAPNILWSMKKFDNAGNPRAGVTIVTDSIGQATVEQFFNNDMARFKQPGANQPKPFIEVQSSGPANAPGMYEMQFVKTDNQVHGRNVYFVRDGTGYIVVLIWAADATPAELSQLDSVRRVMDLPRARAP